MKIFQFLESEDSSKRTPAPIPYDQHERDMLKVIDERDTAEQALSQAYYLVTGNSPEWSNHFGHTEALEEIDTALRLLKSAAKQQNDPSQPHSPGSGDGAQK